MRAPARTHDARHSPLGIGVAILAMLMVGLFQPVGAQETPRSCDLYETQPEAQNILDQNPQFEEFLDPDGNGIACEELPETDPSPTGDFTSCDQFESREDAQRELNDRSDDSPERRFALDADGDGMACEDTFGVGDGEQPGNLRTCDDFANQEEAQAYFDTEATDLQGSVLDSDGDFLACEDAYRAPTVVVCIEETGRLIEVSESARRGFDTPNHLATEAEIAAEECEMTPGADGEPAEDDTRVEAGSGAVSALPSTGSGTAVDHAPQEPLLATVLATMLVLTVAAIGVRMQSQRAQA